MNDIDEKLDEQERTEQAIDVIRYPKGNYDSYTFLSKAVREYCNDEPEKIRNDVARIVAKIIDTAFLDGVIANHQALIDKEKKRHTGLLSENFRLENENRKLRDLNQSLRVTRDEIEKAIIACDGKRIRVAETDPAFYGAMKCYEFIYERTRNINMASKAFDCYLLGGKYPECVPDSPENFLDAKETIKEVYKKNKDGMIRI